MSVTEEMHDRRGHEIKGQAVEQRMRGVHVGEAGREESPSSGRHVGGQARRARLNSHTCDPR
jgi:hypothetical protein